MLFLMDIVHFDLNLSDTVTDFKTSAELINWLDTTQYVEFRPVLN